MIVKKCFLAISAGCLILLPLLGNCMDFPGEGNIQNKQQHHDQQDHSQGGWPDEGNQIDSETDGEIQFQCMLSDFGYPPEHPSKYSDTKITVVFTDEALHISSDTVQSTDNSCQVGTSSITSHSGSSNELSALMANSKNQLNTPFTILKDYRFGTGKSKKEMTALATYKQNRISADELRFIQAMDREFFNYANNSEYIPFLCVPFMWPAAFATSAGTTYAIGNFLKIIKNSKGDIAFTVWNVVTHAPLYGRQFYQEGKGIAAWLCGTEPFQPRSDGDKFLPRTYKKSISHYVAYGTTGLAAFIHATTSLAFLYVAEKYYFYSFFLPTGPLLLTSEFMRNLSRIKRNVDRQFIRGYDNKVGEDIHGMRRYLLQQNGQFQQALCNDYFVNASYDLIGNSNGVDYTQQDSMYSYFRISLLFLRNPGSFNYFHHESPVNTPKKNRQKFVKDSDNPIERMNLQNRKLKKEKADLTLELAKTENSKNIAQSLQPSAMRSFSDTANSAVLYTASFARLAGMEYLLGTAIIALIASQTEIINVETIMISAFAIALYEIFFKAVAERPTLQNYVPKLLNDLIIYENQKICVWYKEPSAWFNKLLGGIPRAVSVTNGVLSSLKGTVASLSAFRNWSLPLPFQVVALVPDFIVNTADHAQFNEEHLKGLAIDAITTWTASSQKEDMSVRQKRAWLEHYSYKLIPLLETGWDGNTIRLLFQITQRAK